MLASSRLVGPRNFSGPNELMIARRSATIHLKLHGYLKKKAKDFSKTPFQESWVLAVGTASGCAPADSSPRVLETDLILLLFLFQFGLMHGFAARIDLLIFIRTSTSLIMKISSYGLSPIFYLFCFSAHSTISCSSNP